MSDKIYPISVIGGGAAGVMATLRSVLNNDETLFFPGSAKNKKRSRALWVGKIENIPGLLGYKKGIEGPNRETLEFLEKGEFSEKFHWKKNTGVTSIEKENGLFKITDTNGKNYLSEHVILATGAMDIQPEIGGSIEPIFPYANAQLIDYCIRCDGHHVIGKETAIIGHTNSAAWVGVMLYERYQTPSMIILTNGHEPEFNGEVQKLINLYHIEVRTEKIVDVRGTPAEKSFEGFTLENGDFVHSEFAFISLGMMVYNKFALDLGADIDERGYVKTGDKGESSVAGLYIAGDLRANTKKQVYTAWDTAVDSADDINAKIRKKRRYELLEKGGYNVEI